jgi:hypothetical protein
LKFMPESIELAAMATNRLAELTSADSPSLEATPLDDAEAETASPGDSPGTERRKA